MEVYLLSNGPYAGTETKRVIGVGWESALHVPPKLECAWSPWGWSSVSGEVGCYSIIDIQPCVTVFSCVRGGVMSQSKMKATWSIRAGCELEKRAKFISL